MAPERPIIEHSELLGRPIRTDGIATLGTSSLTLFDEAAADRDFMLAAELLDYFWAEMLRIGEALFAWIDQIIAFRITRDLQTAPNRTPAVVLQGLRRFEPSQGDRNRAIEQLERGNPEDAAASAELGRVRYASLHDAYVAWIQQLLTDIAVDYGDEAVLETVMEAYEILWKPRYAVWNKMTAEQRLQLSVEGMRGHLSGPRRRGDVGIIEEPDRYTMILDPCGSCGILRRGDPESGRPPAEPASNQQPHAWSWQQRGKSWYSLHSPIVMEWLDMRQGRPPFRPLESCDTEGPCHWLIYKDPLAARPEHYERMGFVALGRRE